MLALLTACSSPAPAHPQAIANQAAPSTIHHCEEPTTKPPPLRVETVATRPGYFWIRGHWDWQGQWVRIGGRFEREHAGYAWQEGRWELRGCTYWFIDGLWVVSGH